jgi:uncharacterized protein YgiM (DUF1202 family)
MNARNTNPLRHIGDVVQETGLSSHRQTFERLATEKPSSLKGLLESLRRIVLQRVLSAFSALTGNFVSRGFELSAAKTQAIVLLALSLFLLTIPIATAQEETDTGVWATTQDFSSLREGPGLHFARIAVVPPAVTVPVLGRSANGRWVQVEYDGQQGWVAYWLLVWSGDLASAPVDGVDSGPFIRLGVTATILENTILFNRRFLPTDITLPEGTVVEITGRQGSGLYIWMQIRYQGQYYWVRSWEIEDLGGIYTTVFDVSYLNPYFRFRTGLDRDITGAVNTLSRIESIWERLAIGETVSCTVPAYANRRLSDAEVRRLARFTPLVVALDNAIADINSAVSTFADACGREGERLFLTERDVRAALDVLNRARRNLVLARSLLNSL